MSLISNPLFRSNNIDQLEVADAYDVTDSRPINKLYDSVKNGAAGLLQRPNITQEVVGGIVNLFEAKEQGLKGVDLLNAGLGSFNASTASILRTVSDDIIGKAGEFLDVDPDMVAMIKTNTQEIAQRVEYGDLGDIGQYSELVSLMGSMTGNTKLEEYINIGYESAVWGAALSNAVDMGMDGYYGVVRADVDPVVYRRAVMFTVPSVSSSGRLESLVQLLGAVNGDVILTSQPDFIKRFLSKFVYPTPTPSDIEAFAIELHDTLSLVDSQWYNYSTERGDVIFDLESLVGISDTAHQVLTLHPIVGMAIQIAKDFPEQDVITTMQDQYTMMVV